MDVLRVTRAVVEHQEVLRQGVRVTAGQEVPPNHPMPADIVVDAAVLPRVVDRKRVPEHASGQHDGDHRTVADFAIAHPPPRSVQCQTRAAPSRSSATGCPASASTCPHGRGQCAFPLDGCRNIARGLGPRIQRTAVRPVSSDECADASSGVPPTNPYLLHPGAETGAPGVLSVYEAAMHWIAASRGA